MKNFYTNFEWFDRLIPEGIPIPSSILISGPGGSGKPLIGLVIITSWLRQGGKVVFVPLQYPGRGFIDNDLSRLYNLKLSDFPGSFFFIDFDLGLSPTAEAVQELGPEELKANLVNPEVWDQVLKIASQKLGPSSLGTLVFSSALNLLLFSPTYGERMLKWLKNILIKDKSQTYLFTVSSSALKEKIEILEGAVDHLMYSEMYQPEKKLYLRIARLQKAAYVDKKIVVPIEKKVLEDMKEIAESSRTVNIPEIRKI